MAVAETIERCKRLVEDVSYPTVVEWRRHHPSGKVAGYFPVFVPAEIIHAAGMFPLGIRGAGSLIDIKEADASFPGFVCGIPRSSMQLAINGNVELDVMLFTPICDVARNLPQLWTRKFPRTSTIILHLPQNLVSEATVGFLISEYQRVIGLLERVAGNRITPEKLTQSIALYNQQRQLMRQLYSLRTSKPWLISTAELYALARVGTMTTVEESISILKEVVSSLPERLEKPVEKLRVLWEGGFCEQPPYELLERLDDVCYVVDDDFALIHRWYQADVPSGRDPLRVLAESYRDLFAYCSVQHDERRPKWQPFLDKVKASGAQAVVLCAPKFCEPGLDDQVAFGRALDREGIPHLSLDFEEKMTSYDTMVMQLETFLESQMLFGKVA